ncbi:MAG: type II secretion system protein GspH [Sphingobium sp.]|nr:type II secretion system protein GspH [Sphingobium sp.]
MRKCGGRGFPSLTRSAGQGFTYARRSAGQGFTYARRSTENGFTLVELMVVIAIIGFASAAVLLMMPDPRGRLVDDADGFAMRVAAARDHAIIRARPVAFWVSPTAYGFEQQDKGQWTAMDNGPFRAVDWSHGTRAFLDVKKATGGTDTTQKTEKSDAPSSGRVVIRFDSMGLPGEAARLVLRRDGEEVAVTLDGAGRVKVGG